MKNVQIGIYYGQYSNALEQTFENFTDLKIFDPKDCTQLEHCTVSKAAENPNDPNFYIQLMLSKAEFVSLNLIPK